MFINDKNIIKDDYINMNIMQQIINIKAFLFVGILYFKL